MVAHRQPPHAHAAGAACITGKQLQSLQLCETAQPHDGQDLHHQLQWGCRALAATQQQWQQQRQELWQQQQDLRQHSGAGCVTTATSAMPAAAADAGVFSNQARCSRGCVLALSVVHRAAPRSSAQQGLLVGARGGCEHAKCAQHVQQAQRTTSNAVGGGGRRSEGG